MQSQPVRGYRFAEFTLDLARRRLTGNGVETLPLSGRAFEVLAYLVTNRDRMVTKRELMDAVWPRSVVEENNLTQAISNVRRALGDSRDSPQFIATIAGRGYQFVADVQVLTAAAAADIAPSPTLLPLAAPAAESAPAASTREVPIPHSEAGAMPAPSTADGDSRPSITGALSRRGLLLGAGLAAGAVVAAALWWPRRRGTLPASIAVLPFKPLLPDSRNEAIEIGMAELLINRLSPLPGVIVKPLSSVRRYAAVDQDAVLAGRELDVEAVVDGTVQIEHDDVRLTARLLDVTTGESLWAGNFTQKLGNFFAVQDALVNQLVSALAVQMPLQGVPQVSGSSTADTEAWQLYANGRYQLERRDPDGIDRAKAFFRDAIARDPGFALAVTGLSEACALAGTFGIVPPAQAFEDARTAAQQALAIEPNLPVALTALGHVLTQSDRNWKGGRELYERALHLAPNAAWTHAFLALNLVQSGSVAAALEHIERAQWLEPAAVPFMALAGFVQYHARQFDAARRQLGRIVEAAPGAVLPRQFLARVLLAQGDAAEVVRLLEGRNEPAPGSYSSLGRAYAMTGNAAAARAEIARVEDEGRKGFGVGFDLALLHLALGDTNAAYPALERAVDDCSQMLGYLNVDAALDPIRDEPRVRAIARRLGLA
jgi:DNA-binding winged helix-turn-helix (wHTH) protein/TolB-like protein/Tfp pilus assembly protein PilF